MDINNWLYHAASGTITAGLWEAGSPKWAILSICLLHIGQLAYNLVKTIIKDIKQKREAKKNEESASIR